MWAKATEELADIDKDGSAILARIVLGQGDRRCDPLAWRSGSIVLKLYGIGM